MKKTIVLLLALIMIFALAACGQKTEAAPEATPEPTFPFDNDSTPFDVSTLTADEVAKIKVGFIFLHDETSTYDLNFMNAAFQACENTGVDYIIKTNIPEGQECYDAAAELVDAGCTHVFADSFGHEPYMIQAAKEFKDVEFCHATGVKAHTEALPNYHNAFATIYEGRYLAGVAAGMKLQERIDSGKITADQAKVGYIGAFTYAEVISGYTSWYLGVKSIVPQVTMEVTFTGSWYDETAEREAANNLINNGCVLISQHADSMGAPTACETAGVPNVSYNGSTADACPNTFIVSSRINWCSYFYTIIGRIAQGSTINMDWTGNLANGAVELTELGPVAPVPGTAEKLEEVKADLISGKTHVFDVSTFTVTVDDTKNQNATVDADGHLTSYKADVNDWGTFHGDTEVVFDGYFHESEFRSGPVFDLQIDGITLLDVNFG